MLCTAYLIKKTKQVALIHSLLSVCSVVIKEVKIKKDKAIALI